MTKKYGERCIGGKKGKKCNYENKEKKKIQQKIFIKER
jgi:hypothetical protein